MQFHAFVIFNLLGGTEGTFLYTMKEKTCPVCYKGLKLKKVIDQSTAVMRCKHCRKDYKLTFDEKTFPYHLNSFSWGAFGLWPLWGIWNGAGWLFAVNLLLGWMSATPLFVISVPITLFISLRYGFIGKRFSWQKLDWSSIENFEKYQKAWDVAGVIAITVSVILFIIVLSNL